MTTQAGSELSGWLGDRYLRSGRAERNRQYRNRLRQRTSEVLIFRPMVEAQGTTKPDAPGSFWVERRRRTGRTDAKANSHSLLFCALPA